MNSAGRRDRGRFAEVFVNMIQYPENEWIFSEDRELFVEELHGTHSSRTWVRSAS
ncbi:MAG: hypothetical protein HYV07_32670 [Deltaproteobacteria bacterium]|nr:hypothetical protein [Deltaproteobacteria bacterium]